MLNETHILLFAALLLPVSACTSSLNIDPATSDNYCTTLKEKSFERAKSQMKAIEAGKAGMSSMVHFQAIATKQSVGDDIMVTGMGPKHIKVKKNVFLRLENRGSYLYAKTKADVVATIKEDKIICGPAELAES